MRRSEEKKKKKFKASLPLFGVNSNEKWRVTLDGGVVSSMSYDQRECDHNTFVLHCPLVSQVFVNPQIHILTPTITTLHISTSIFHPAHSHWMHNCNVVLLLLPLPQA